MQLDSKSHETSCVESQMKQLKADSEKADQINSDLRGKMMDKQLEVESLQVAT